MSILVISKSKAPTTAKSRGRRELSRRYDFCFRQQNKIGSKSSSDRRYRRRIGRQRFRRRRFRRGWRRRRWIIWHWCSPLNESFLLQPLAVNLINANEAADEIPIFLICESMIAGGPGQLTRRFRMIRVVNEITFNSIILRGRFSFVDQDRVIDAETRISGEKTDE